MRWKLKKERNKKYKLFSTRLKSFRSCDFNSHMNLRTVIRNPKTNAVTGTIINKSALKFYNTNNKNLPSSSDR